MSNPVFCAAIKGGNDEHQLKVDDLYVFGDYQHGVIALTKRCSAGGIRVRIVEEESQKSISQAAEKRVLRFKKALLFTPHSSGGMFRVSAIVDIDTVNFQLTLTDVQRFEEVNREERDEIFLQLRKNGVRDN